MSVLCAWFHCLDTENDRKLCFYLFLTEHKRAARNALKMQPKQSECSFLLPRLVAAARGAHLERNRTSTFSMTGPIRERGRGQGWCWVSQPENVTAMVASANVVSNLLALWTPLADFLPAVCPVGVNSLSAREGHRFLEILRSRRKTFKKKEKKRKKRVQPALEIQRRDWTSSSSPRRAAAAGGGVNRSQVLPYTCHWQLDNIWQHVSSSRVSFGGLARHRSNLSALHLEDFERVTSRHGH